MGIAIAGLTSDARVLRYFTFTTEQKPIKEKVGGGKHHPTNIYIHKITDIVTLCELKLCDPRCYTTDLSLFKELFQLLLTVCDYYFTGNYIYVFERKKKHDYG